MSGATTVVLTLAAGGIGAVLRTLVVRALPSAGTGIVNIVGTCVLALALVGHGSGALATSWTVVVAVGLTGALTTFSGWIMEVERALRERPIRALAVQVLAPLLLGVALTVVAFAGIG